MPKEKVKISDEVLEQFYSSHPEIFIGYHIDPGHEYPDGWCKKDEKLPEDLFCVTVIQNFPVFRPCDEVPVTRERNIQYWYVGDEFSIKEMLKYKDVLRESVVARLEGFLKDGMATVVIPRYNEKHRKNVSVPVVGVNSDVFVFDSFEQLNEAVKTLLELHGALISKPISNGIKVYDKRYGDF